MNRKVARIILACAASAAMLVAAGCGSAPSLRSVSKPSESKRQFLSLKKVAILPLNNINGDKGAEDQAMSILVSELNIRKTFQEVEDPHYVGSVLKALKLRKVDDLDLETVQKMGSEMGAQGLIFGDIHAWGLGEGDEAAMHVNLTLTLIDTTTGKPIWIGNGAERASFTWSRAIGLNEGPADLEVGRNVIIDLVKRMDKEVRKRQEEELARIKAEEAAKLKAAAEAEKRRLEEMIKEEEPKEAK